MRRIPGLPHNINHPGIPLFRPEILRDAPLGHADEFHSNKIWAFHCEKLNAVAHIAKSVDWTSPEDQAA